MEPLAINLISLLSSLNRAISIAIVILSFSLLIYILTYNLRSSVARSFSALIACVCITYTGDAALFATTSLESALPWLRLQWIGIAFTPAAYLHFSDSLLRTTNSLSALRRWTVRGGYLVGFILVPLAFWTSLLVYDGIHSPGLTQFRAGPLFWLFSAYFFATVIWGAYNTVQARRRCLTHTSRRRMTYLAVSFAAPALGVFPYLLIASTPSTLLSQAAFFTVLLVGNLGIAAMIAVMAYSVAYFGVLTPDRVVKHNLIHFLLRGPLLATAVIFVFLAMPKMAYILNLPREAILVAAVAFVIVTGQLIINLAKPIIDRVVFHRDREEVVWIQELDRRLLTTTDLQQALENILAALCELLRVHTGFIANLGARSGPRLETYYGSQETIESALRTVKVDALVAATRDGRSKDIFVRQDGFWFALLRTQSRDAILGLLALEASERTELSEHEQEIATTLIAQAERVLEDRALQHNVFNVLRRIIPELEQVQRLRGTARYTGSPGLETLPLSNPIHSPEFTQMVREALNHYWGGPQLAHSPLLGLRVVQESLAQHQGNPVRALRAVLGQAIANLRPDGERQMTTAEWLLYNILELKFIQGLRVRDVAQRLAMSESDFYRKQRIAIEEVARALKAMEQQGLAGSKDHESADSLEQRLGLSK
ncbi:MAG: histidine kinase N-terminal 7TM domain-containing protein [Anaerolineae bacterium]